MPPRKNILIVDDERFFREILKGALEERFNIIEGNDGDEAVSLALKHKPDLIILDIEMPCCDGIETCKILSQDYPEVKVLALSMYEKASFIQQMLKNGALRTVILPLMIFSALAICFSILRISKCALFSRY